MTEPKKSALKQLHAIRDAFEATAKKHLAEMDQVIWNAELEEAQREKEAFIAKLLPQGSDQSVLADHDFVFLIGQFKTPRTVTGSLPGLSETLPGAALDTAYQVSAMLKDIPGVNVRAALWGGTGTSGVYLGKYETVRDTLARTDIMDDRQFLPVAKEILAASMPDSKQAGRQTHYIVISDGKITDSLDDALAVLTAAKKLNAKVTLDIIVDGADKSNFQKLGQMAGRALLAETPQDVVETILYMLKDRLSPFPNTPAPAQPVAKAETPAPAAVEPKAEAPQAEPPKPAPPKADASPSP